MDHGLKGFFLDDDDSAAEDSGEDEAKALDNTLCTFTITQKEFMNQHWLATVIC